MNFLTENFEENTIFSKMTLFENTNWNTSSLSSYDQFDWNDIFFGKDIGLLYPDPIDLISDEQIPLRSIHLDCKQIESSLSFDGNSEEGGGGGGSSSSGGGSCDGLITSSSSLSDDLLNGCSTASLNDDDYLFDESTEFDSISKKIRNRDCMWSGSCINTQSTVTNRKQTSQQQQTMQQQQQMRNIQNTNNSNNSNGNSNTTSNNTNSNKVTEMTAIRNLQKQKQSNVVPPGTSLLLNSKMTQQQRKKQQQQMLNFTIPNITTVDFLKERESMPIARPDTPLSLDDDPPEFKHTVDLAACVMGSNNICLDIDPDKMIINKLKEQLEDTTTKNIDLRLIPGNKNRSLSEVLNVIESENTIQMAQNMVTKIEPDDYDDDEEEDDDDDREEEIDDNDEDDDSEIDDFIDILPKMTTTTTTATSKATTKRNILITNYHHNHSAMSSPSSSSSSSSSSEINDSVTHDDHCYTRSNNVAIDVVGMGLETPSDSDEEIDVVSIGDRKLPNNPSDKDRRVLQTKVANKISARIVKTVNGIRTIPPRRRCSYEPYTAPVTPVKNSSASSTAASSRYSTPISTPYSYHNHQKYYNNHSLLATSASSITSNSNSSKNSNIRYPTNSRKRSAPQSSPSSVNGIKTTENRHHQQQQQQQNLPSNKRHRSTKKHKSLSSSSPLTTTNGRKHGNYTMDEAETIEKRNLHNDMERQRRIGLKNLFEALKKHIPSIKDKERAPKVNILREAAEYCDALKDEEKKLMAHKHQLKIQFERRMAQLQILQMSSASTTCSGNSLSSLSSSSFHHHHHIKEEYLDE